MVRSVTVSNEPVTATSYGPSELDRLASMYPAFRFTLEVIGRHGSCWVARRKSGMRPGPHTVITSDLAELHAALASPDRTGHAWRRQPGEVVPRARRAVP
jgi:hypothetical protein